MQCACAILAVWLSSIFPHNLINDMIFRGKKFTGSFPEVESCRGVTLTFSQAFVACKMCETCLNLRLCLSNHFFPSGLQATKT
jgi:hypothetical protein